MSASNATPPSLCYGFLNKFHLLHGHLLHDQKFYGHMYPGQLLLRPLPLDIQSLTKIWSAVPEKWLLGQMLPGQMSPGQMLYEQMLHGQLLPGQLLILSGFGKGWTSFGDGVDRAGICTDSYRANSVRSAGASGLRTKGMSLAQVLARGNWSPATKTFSIFYDRSGVDSRSGKELDIL